MLLLLPMMMWACQSADVVAVGDVPDDASSDGGAPVDTGQGIDTGPPPPVDDDSDGFLSDVDCDDRDPAVHPDAEERFNGVDDDCDGAVDADGEYVGSVGLTAYAVVEGQRHDFSLVCDAMGQRGGDAVAFVASCVPETDDAWAQSLLGSELRLVIDGAGAVDQAWSGRCELISTPGLGGGEGWDTWCDATLAWADVRTVALAADRSTVSLVVDLVGGLAR